MRSLALALAASIIMSGCSTVPITNEQAIIMEAESVLAVSVPVVEAYAAGPKSDPIVVADLRRLETAVQEAVALAKASSTQTDMAALTGALVALAAYAGEHGVTW